MQSEKTQVQETFAFDNSTRRAAVVAGHALRRRCRFVAVALGIAVVATASALVWQSSAGRQPASSVAAASTLDWQYRLEGQPGSFFPGSNPGVYFWHNEPAGLSLRTTDPPGQAHEYTGTITTDGTIINLTPVQLESNDFYNLGPFGHVLTFDFHTADELDGLDFEIAGGTGVKLEANWDGQPIPMQDFYIGQYGVHPLNNSMWFCRAQNGDCLANLP